MLLCNAITDVFHANNITTSETEPLPSVHLGSNPQCETICVVYQCRNFFFFSYVLRGKFQKKEGGNENIWKSILKREKKLRLIS